MTTFRTTLHVQVDRRATIQLPLDVKPGVHHITVVVDGDEDGERRPIQIPVDDVGPWPEDLSLRREDLYDDDVR